MAFVTALLLALVGCDGAADEAPRSVPAEPTVDLGDPEGQGVKWATLDAFVTSSEPAVPEALGGLALGMPEAQVRTILEELHDERLPVPQEVELQGYRVLGASLRAHEEVAVTAIIDMESGTLDQIDIAVPADQALYAFTEAWGQPDMVTHPKLGPLATWTNPDTGLVVELAQGGGTQGRGVAKLRRAEPGENETPADQGEAEGEAAAE